MKEAKCSNCDGYGALFIPSSLYDIAKYTEVVKCCSCNKFAESYEAANFYFSKDNDITWLPQSRPQVKKEVVEEFLKKNKPMENKTITVRQFALKLLNQDNIDAPIAFYGPDKDSSDGQEFELNPVISMSTVAFGQELGIYLRPVTKVEEEWRVSTKVDSFKQIKLTLDYGYPTPEYIKELTRLLGYALKANMVGQELQEPTVGTEDGRAVLIYDYDSDTSIRSEWHLEEAVSDFFNFHRVGTPIRTKGPNKGTRMIHGYGNPFTGSILFN